MAGVPGATLTGWAIPFTPNTDHTYVVSSCGLRWRCWGRDQGGRPLGSAPGDSSIADCLSQKQSRAGIVYGVTGVCHQTANRILYPAQKTTVRGCRGYTVSVMAYGKYGLGPWPERQACIPPVVVVKDSPVTKYGHQSHGTDRNSLLSRTVYHLRRMAGAGARKDEEPITVTELSGLVQAALGRRLDEQTMAALEAVQARLRQQQAELVEALSADQLTRREYLMRLNAAFANAMRESERVLGHENFMAVFGEAGHTPEELIDAEIFLNPPERAPR